jgi:hypothetical protein
MLLKFFSSRARKLGKFIALRAIFSLLIQLCTDRADEGALDAEVQTVNGGVKLSQLAAAYLSVNEVPSRKVAIRLTGVGTRRLPSKLSRF